MDKLRKSRLLKVSVVVLAFVGTYLLGFGSAASIDHGWIGQQITASRLGIGKPDNTDFTLFWDVWNRVHKDYVKTPDDQKLTNSAIEGMVAGLGDPYTIYMPPDETKLFNQDITGKFFGVGIEIGIQNKALTVIAPLDDLPAQKAGIKSGDIIVKVDSKDTSGMTINDALLAIRGEDGTKVTLTVLSKDATTTHDVTITRALVTVKSVKWSYKNNNIGYLRISQFSDDTTDLARTALNEFKSKSVKGVIIDLRDDPGGYLDGAREIVGMFVKPGVAVSEQDKSGHKDDLATIGAPIMPDIPLVVLVNGGSASASEIVSGALQDYGRAKLVGEKTFGKGSVQQVEDLAGGASLKVTIAQWLTPKGRMINGTGIEPDKKITMTDADVSAGKDPQLDKAIEILNTK